MVVVLFEAVLSLPSSLLVIHCRGFPHLILFSAAPDYPFF